MYVCTHFTQNHPYPNSLFVSQLVSFSPTIKMMSSIRRPKCISAFGNDQREYRYLVKGGEDTRQDQRISELFQSMNDIFQHDPETAKRQLKIQRYNIIPMNQVFFISGLC